MIPIEKDIEKIYLISKQKEDENFRFRNFLKRLDSHEVDKIVSKIHSEVTRQIDCTECGNCCHSLKPSVTEKEIQRLSELVQLPTNLFVEKNVELDSFDKVQCLKDTPCIFLKDTKCSVYEDRPEDCKSYPHTHKNDFTSRVLGVIYNYGICPIVFNIFERLKIELHFRR